MVHGAGLSTALVHFGCDISIHSNCPSIACSKQASHGRMVSVYVREKGRVDDVMEDVLKSSCPDHAIRQVDVLALPSTNLDD